MSKNSAKNVIFYSKTDDRTFIPEEVMDGYKLEKLLTPSFFIAFRALLEAPEKKKQIMVKMAAAKDKNTVEGFTLTLKGNRSIVHITEKCDEYDVVRLQRDIILARAQKDKQGKDKTVEDIKSLISDYAEEELITKEVLEKIINALCTEESGLIAKDLISEYGKNKVSNTTFLSFEDYEKAIKLAEKEFTDKGYGFFGGVEDEDEGEKIPDVMTQKLSMLFDGLLAVTFKLQEDFDAFLEICRRNHVVGSFDIPERIWEFRKYFYFSDTNGNKKLMYARDLATLEHDGIIDGSVFSRLLEKA